MNSLYPCPEETVAENDCQSNRQDNDRLVRTVQIPIRQTKPVLQAAKERINLTIYPPTGEDAFGALESEWNDLLSKSRFSTIFLTYEWQTTWWEYLGDGDLWILAFRDQADTLVGIAPLFHMIYGETGGKDDGGRTKIPAELLGKRRISLVGDVEVSDYLDIIIAQGWEEDIYARLLRWLQSDQAPEWDLLDLCNLPEESLVYQKLSSMAEESGLAVEVRQEDVAPQFILPSHFETYLQEIVDKKQRHEIRRKQRRAESDADIGFYMIGNMSSRAQEQLTSAELDAEMDDFIRLQRASTADKAEFMTPVMQRFFRAMTKRMYDAGYLRLSFLTVNGEKAATQLTFAYDGRFLLYNSGYDPTAYAQLSPGWVLLAYTIQYAIVEGNWLFDLMQGDEAYKYRVGCQNYNVMRTIVRRV